MNSRDGRGWHGMALVLLFALVATLSIGAHALAPASAGAYQALCDDEDPWDCDAAPPGGGDGTGDSGGYGDGGYGDGSYGDGSWGDTGDNSGWGDSGDGTVGDQGGTGSSGESGGEAGIPTSDSCEALASDYNATLVLLGLAVGSASPEEIEPLEQERVRLWQALGECWDAVVNNTPRIGPSDAGGGQSAPVLPGGSGAAARIENAAASHSKSAKRAQRHRAKRRKQSHAQHP